VSPVGGAPHPSTTVENNAKTDNYQFYEKAATQKMLYRIKMINKNKQTEYSKVIEITPGA
jgi:hypothetical protein